MATGLAVTRHAIDHLSPSAVAATLSVVDDATIPRASPRPRRVIVLPTSALRSVGSSIAGGLSPLYAGGSIWATNGASRPERDARSLAGRSSASPVRGDRIRATAPPGSD